MLTKLENRKVAIVHDWLHTYRGGERVLEAICELFPKADIFTLFHRPGKLGDIISSHQIHTSFLNGLPGIEKYYRYLLPLFPLAAERMDLTPYDLVISSSHCVAKGIIPRPDAKHISYCYTPMRYVWDGYREYFAKSTLEPLIYPFAHYLRQWDVSSSHRVDRFVCLSAYVQKRIEKYYRRPSDIVFPFAALDRFSVGNQQKDYYLIVSALTPYKRVDLAIEACNQLNRKLIVVGQGPEEKRLKQMAGKTISFLNNTSNSELPKLYQESRALLFPGLEDFGITPVESMASGRPVIAFGRGGVTETVIEGKTGLFFDEPSPSSLKEAIVDFERMEKAFDAKACRTQAEKFSRQRFQKEFGEIILKEIYKEGRTSDSLISPEGPRQDLT